MSEQLEKNKRISVSIGGISYQLISQENESYAREIARKADDAIHQILSQHPSLSTTQAIVLAMVNTFDALTKLDHSLDEAKREIRHIEERTAKDIQNAQFNMTKAQHELFSLRDTDFELKKEILRVTELNKQLELEIAALLNKHGITHAPGNNRSDTEPDILEPSRIDDNEVPEHEVPEHEVQCLHGAVDAPIDAGGLPDEPEMEEDDLEEEPFGVGDKYDEAEKLRESIENDTDTESLLDFQDDEENAEYPDEPQHPGNPEDGLLTEKENEFIQEANRQEESFEGYKQTSLEDYFV